MATLNIKDPEVHRLARELARRRGTSATGAVRAALQEALRHDIAQDDTMVDDLLAIGRRSSARTEPFLDEADLYDGDGLPR
ncbi:MAG: type II toxin-antitoxin system VapB family antitoxin [Tetrasphaera sp.]